MQGTFEVELDSSAVASSAFPLIYAAGQVAGPGGPAPGGGPRRRLLSDFDLQKHDAHGSTTVNLAAGTSSGVSGSDPTKERLKNVSGGGAGWKVAPPRRGAAVARMSGCVVPATEVPFDMRFL